MLGVRVFVSEGIRGGFLGFVERGVRQRSSVGVVLCLYSRRVNWVRLVSRDRLLSIKMIRRLPRERRDRGCRKVNLRLLRCAGVYLLSIGVRNGRCRTVSLNVSPLCPVLPSIPCCRVSSFKTFSIRPGPFPTPLRYKKFSPTVPIRVKALRSWF